MTTDLNYQIFNEKQAKIFPRLNVVHENGFYLAGGTALALHLGHRNSLDFDFYCASHFDNVKLSKTLDRTFPSDIIVNLREEDTLFCSINGVNISFFWYKYPLIDPVIQSKGPNLASIKDIAAMKLIAVSQRPAKRDYIDVYFLLGIFNLEEMFSFVKLKYPNFDQYFAYRALTYFDDFKEEESGRGIKVFDKDFSWEKAKKEIFEEVKKHQLAMIKG